MNGFWLGQHVPFHEIMLDHTENNQHVRFIKFEKYLGGPQLTMDIQGDSLVGHPIPGEGAEPGRDVEGTALVNAVISLQRDNRYDSPPTSPSFTDYQLKITAVNYPQSWVDCKPPPHGEVSCCNDHRTPIYTFEATTGDGCPVVLCDPQLEQSGDPTPDLTGSAVIFEGDLYHDEGLTVELADEYNNPHRAVNIACTETAIAKLHRLRHTSASQAPNTEACRKPSRGQRQALLRLLSGDYCGNGRPITQNGLPIRLSFDREFRDIYDLSYVSGFQIKEGDVLDAIWGPYGATCLDTPRLVSEGVLDQPTFNYLLREACGGTIPSSPCSSEDGYVSKAPRATR